MLKKGVDNPHPLWYNNYIKRKEVMNMIPMNWMAATTVVMVNNMRKQQEDNKKRCQRCAELSGCWKGQNGGNPNYCSIFSPKG